MVDRWPILYHQDEARGITTIRAFRLCWSSFRIKDTARVNRRRHRDRYLSIRDLNFAADSHNSFTFGTLFGKVSQLHEVAGQLGIANEHGTCLLRNLDCIADVIAMAVSD